MRILLVECRAQRAASILSRLNHDGHAVDWEASLCGAQSVFWSVDYDLAILNPEAGANLEATLRWLEQCRRAGITTPILVLSPFEEARHRIRALDAGADDCIAGPIDLDELAARARCLLRRRNAHPLAEVTVGPLTLNRDQRLALTKQGALVLTAKELSLLEYLMLNTGRVLSRLAIAEHVWDDAYRCQSNVIDVIMARLRRKLSSAGCDGLLQTVRGSGYVLKEAA